MGQSFRCLSCESRNTKVKSFGTVPRGKKYSKSTLSVLRNAGFHRPMHSSLERFSDEVSRRSSLASISLGSAQTLSSIKVESAANKETTLDAGNKDGSPCTKRHPGMFYNILKRTKRVLTWCQKVTSLARGSNENTSRNKLQSFSVFSRSFADL